MSAPSGFEALVSSPFAGHIGPLLVNRQGAVPIVGLIVRDQHANTMGGVHGGLVLTVADVAIGQTVKAMLAESNRAVTTDMHAMFFGSAQIGDMIEAEASIDHHGRTMLFVTCLVRASKGPIARVSATLSIRSRPVLP